MTFSLYDATVPSFLQTLRATIGWLGKAQTFAEESEMGEAALMQAVLAEDMFAFNRQVRGTAMHSQGALEGAFNGKFSPDPTPAPETIAGLSARLGEAADYLAGLTPAAVNRLIGQPLLFQIGETRMNFTAQDFLLSFSLPNFYFHTTTAYAILRHHGMAIGKRDFLGAVRVSG